MGNTIRAQYYSLGNHLCGLKRVVDKDEYELKTMSAYKRSGRYIKMSKYISTANPRSHVYYRTNTAILLERQKHINSLEYAHIIHPFSAFRMNWEMFMMGVFFLYLLLMPVIVAFFQADNMNHYLLVFSYVEGVLDFICISDILMTFFTGYAINQTKEVVLIPRAITTNYVLSIYFFLDILSSMPTETIVHLMTLFKSQHSFFVRYIHLAALFKAIRVRTLLTYMNRAAELWRVNESVLNFFKYAFITFLFLHWCGCLQYIVPLYWYSGNMPNESWTVRRNTVNMSVFDKYVECIFKASCQLLCISNNMYNPTTEEDKIMDIILGVFGYALTGLALVVFVQFLFREHTSEIKYHSIMNQLRQYMRHKQLPLPMQKRLIDYYEYRFRKSYFRENTIFPTISDRLRKSISTYVCFNLVKKVPILKDLPPIAIANIVPCLRPEVFLPNDIIVKAGTLGDCMYFIHCGTVSVYTPTGKEVCHLQDGAYFGEMGLISKDQKRIANVVAIEISEVYRLERKYFNAYIKTLPDTYKKIERVAERRRENTLVMEEIHRKHILEKTMRMMDDRGI